MDASQADAQSVIEAQYLDPEDVSEEDYLRAGLYALLGRALASPPDQDTLAQLADLSGDDTALGHALAALGAAARAADPASASDEYHALFIGVNGGELNPYASFYLTGFLYEKPLAELRDTMTALGIEHADDVAEPEDHIASLCEMMAGLIGGSFGAPVDLGTQRDFFNAHVGPWAARFFEDLERAQSAALYMPLGAVGRLFMDIEREGFKMAA